MTPNHRLTYTLGVDCFLRADLLADGADITGAEARLDEDAAVVCLDGRAAEAKRVLDAPGDGLVLLRGPTVRRVDLQDQRDLAGYGSDYPELQFLS